MQKDVLNLSILDEHEFNKMFTVFYKLSRIVQFCMNQYTWNSLLLYINTGSS